jgi:hypothetical protein
MFAACWGRSKRPPTAPDEQKPSGDDATGASTRKGPSEKIKQILGNGE